jgi:hypothetical protein
MNGTPRRPWWRLHGLTFGIGTSLFISLAAANVIGDAWHHPKTGYEFGERGAYYGWPIRFAVDANSWNGLTSARRTFLRTGRESPTTPWPIGKTVNIFAPSAAIVDAAIGIVVLMGSLWTIERSFRRNTLTVRFSLGFLFAATSWLATYFAFAANLLFTENRIDVVRHIVLIGAALAVGLTWLAFFELLGIVWNRLASRRRAAPGASG